MDKSLVIIQQENVELRKENDGLKQTVDILIVEIDKLRNLEPKNPNFIKLDQTPEQSIIDDQIRALEQFSRVRILTLEEVRALDLLIKNKKILEKDKPIEPPYTDLSADSSQEDLLQLASGQNEEQKPRKRNKTKTGSKDPLE